MPFTLELKDVSFAYAGSGEIVKSVSVAVRPGEVLVVAATTGMGGKSALLKLCAGLLAPTKGTLVLDGKNFWGLSTTEQNEYRHRMGFSFEEAALLANMNVFDNLALPLRYYGELAEPEITGLVNSWLKRLRLVPYAALLPDALSRGVQRKVSFIRTMLLGRDFFFWDEPTQGADPAFAEIVKAGILKQKKNGIGQLLITHSSFLLAGTADRALVLDGGAVSYLGPLAGAGPLN